MRKTETDMTPPKIMKAVVDKAIASGFDPAKFEPKLSGYKRISADIYDVVFHFDGKSPSYVAISHSEIMFSHAFCKSYFGDELTSSLSELRQRNWQLHIQALALTPPEERLSYLGKFI